MRHAGWGLCENPSRMAGGTELTLDEALLDRIGEVEADHWWFTVRRRIVLSVLESLALPEGARLVEIGCGTGGTLANIASSHPAWRCLGIEPNARACTVARRRGCHVVEAALPHLPVDDATATCVLALDVLEHCQDDVAAVREIDRVLVPDGFLVATVPALPSLWSIHDELNAHHRRYTRASLAAAMRAGGLHLQRNTYFNTILLPLGYASRFMADLTRSQRALGVDTPAHAINATLRTLFSLEERMLRRHDLPIGMSLLAVARKHKEGM